MSFIFANLFLLVSVVTYFVRYEIALLPIDKRIRLRNRIGPVKFDRHVQFEDVHAVRLTIGGSSADSTIEVLCDNEDIECPATPIPRQQALFLAVLLGVQLIKVCREETDSGSTDCSDRAI